MTALKYKCCVQKNKAVHYLASVEYSILVTNCVRICKTY